MRDLQERRRWRAILHSPVFLVILSIIVVSLLRSNYNIYKKNQIAKINRGESDKKLAQLVGKHDRLSSLLKKLDTERGVEEELRNKFQITKSGERVLVVVDEEGQQDYTGTTTIDQGYWEGFKSFFGW